MIANGLSLKVSTLLICPVLLLGAQGRTTTASAAAVATLNAKIQSNPDTRYHA